MSAQQTLFNAFAALHVPGDPLVLFNVWDAGSALAVKRSGAKAIATGSYSVAKANGYEDGENTPLDLVIENAGRILRAVDLPVTIDFETGYGSTPEMVAASLSRLLDAGIVGANIEDGRLDGDGMTSIDTQMTRLQALVSARSSTGVPAWINARTDVFLVTPADKHSEHLQEAIERGAAYAEAGAHGFFVPGLADLDLIAEICEASSLPVNVMASGKGPSVSDFANTGVARVSFGGHPWRLMMKKLADEAAKAIAQP